MNESGLEQAALGWFEAMGVQVLTGVEVAPGGALQMRETLEDVVLIPVLRRALRRINPDLPERALETAALIISRPPEPTMMQNNRWFHRLLTEGIDVEVRDDEGEIRGEKVWLADFETPNQNTFTVVSQLVVRSSSSARRPDLVLFINGLPVVVIELKSLSRRAVELNSAKEQLAEYQQAVPALFTYNELLVASDGDTTLVGALGGESARYSPWRASNAEHGGSSTSSLEAVIRTLFSSDSLLEYFRFCVIFSVDDRGILLKRVAAHHQFRAATAARRAILQARKPDGDGRGGVVWHTQGSGKSITMLVIAGMLVADPVMENPTIVVVTDRNDLDAQLFGTFGSGSMVLRQTPTQATTREDLREKLSRAAGGVVFTTIQKFAESESALTQRTNVVVLADEAHRSQYGFIDGGARWMRDSLPNATFVGFSGTPLEAEDRSTRAIFGEYIDIYDIQQSISDGATVPIYYEMRLIRLLPDEEGISAAEQELSQAFDADSSGATLPPSAHIPLEQLIGSEPRIGAVATEIVEHFEFRQTAISGKAMVVCMSRAICMDLYDAIVQIRPEWHSEDDDLGAIKVVMTGNPSEGSRVQQHSGSKARRENLARRLKDPNDSLQLVIVCDMWLTGFDCPPLQTLYLDRPLAGHNLMQAITRVNRVFNDKPGGVIVDFLGVADQLRAATLAYTRAGGMGDPIDSVQEDAVPIMLRELEALRDFFDRYDYTGFVSKQPVKQIESVINGVEYVLEQADGKARFMAMVATCTRAFSLSVPLPEALAVQDELSFFQSVRAAMRKRLSNSREQDSAGAAVKQVVSGAVALGGVIDLFEAAGLPDPNVALLSDEFLDGLGKLPQRNLAFEALRKLLVDQVQSRERVNIVQARTFRQSLEDVLRKYTNRSISTAEVIDELIAVARYIREAVAAGELAGLTSDETAFYDALADNASARELLQDDKLRAIARDLAERIRQKATLDWTQRDSVRADIRRTVRRLLSKYGYPPDAQENATRLIIDQAEAITEHQLQIN